MLRPTLLMSIATLALSACATPTLDMRAVAPVFNEAPVQNRPVTRPLRAVTSFSESLACMDRMLRDQRVGTTLITSKDIIDPTSRASVATKQMIITTLSQMSRVSNAFRFVDYELNLLRQDTVQNLTGLLLSTNQMRLQRPAIYISGAIAYVDQGIIRAGEQAGTSATRLELGYSADRNATLIGLELHLGDFTTRTLVPGIDSANDIVFGSRSEGLDAAARISRYGVQFNMSRSTVMGAGAAVRTLVELGLIEIVGKWARVPYWQCLMLERTTPAFERQFKEWFDASDPVVADAPGLSSPQRRLFHTKRALAAAGYFNGVIDPKQTKAFREALARYQSDHNLIPSGELTFPTFQSLFQSYVTLNEDGTLERVGWEDLATQAKTPLNISLSIANQQFAPDEFTAGARIFFTAAISRQAHLYCYYQDARGRVSRLFPNPFQRTSALPGNRLVRIPDWLTRNPGFNLRAASPGNEQVNCYATESDMFAKLPAQLTGKALAPLPGVNSLAAVDQAFDDLSLEHEIAKANEQWTVKANSPINTDKLSAREAIAKPTSTQAETSTQSEALGASAASEPARQTEATVHQVNRGDHLSRIAKQYRVSVSDLRRWNNLCSDVIKAGQKLAVSSSASPNTAQLCSQTQQALKQVQL